MSFGSWDIRDRVDGRTQETRPLTASALVFPRAPKDKYGIDRFDIGVLKVSLLLEISRAEWML